MRTLVTPTFASYLGRGKQDIVVPILTGSDYLWWAHSWHMQTPLETLGAGSIVVFELIRQV